MRWAKPNEGGKVRDQDRIGDMTIYVIAHLTRLPCEQPPSFIRVPFRNSRTDLLSQQRSRMNDRAMNLLRVIQLRHSRVEQRDYVAHPVMRLCRTELWTGGRLAGVHIHCRHLSPEAARDSHTAGRVGSAGAIRVNATATGARLRVPEVIMAPSLQNHPT